MAPRTIIPTTATTPARADLLVVGARGDDHLAEDVGAVGVSSRYAAAAGFAGEVGQTLLVPAPDDRGADHLLIGLGAEAEIDANRLRSAAGTAGRMVTHHAKVVVALGEKVTEGTTPEAAAEAVTEGWVLGAYRFDEHRSDPSRSDVRSVILTAGGARAARDAVTRGATKARAVCLARDLVNQPGGSLVPADLAERTRAVAHESGLKVRVDGPAALRRKGLGGLLGVGQGATNEPRFVELSYRPEGRAQGHVALVGKGVTFDTGGYSLKSPEGMKTMNSDMGGAAAVIGAMSVLGALGAKTAVTAYLPLVENMIGPDAIRVGDVLTIRGGTTVEVLNTDAEGRLILADALRLASEATPDAIIDLATLTGACPVALGPRTAGLFGQHGALVHRIREVADRCGEAVWPMPMPVDLRPGLDSEVADIRNIGGAKLGGASVAAWFLRRFVDDGIPWAHLDIAGPAWVSDAASGEIPKQGTGFGVRLLAELLTGWSTLE